MTETRLANIEENEMGYAAPVSSRAVVAENPSVAREVATIQAQLVIAKHFPRDEAESFRRIEACCSRPTLANNAVYAYARGGTDISGPSIRLAEAVARAFGNIKYGFEEADNSNGVSKVRAYAYDMETNTQAERIFSVPHIRQTRTGRTALTDPRDIY